MTLDIIFSLALVVNAAMFLYIGYRLERLEEQERKRRWRR